MSTIASTVYKYDNDHYPIPKKHGGARDHQGENPCSMTLKAAAKAVPQHDK
jgi:hypothetical protein